MNIADMRRQYSENGISRAQMHADPMQQFGLWFEESVTTSDQEWMESNAMTLSTADLSGNVTSRTVLLKGYDEQGFLFFTSYSSAKGKQLEANPHASLLFYWGQLSRQVRVEGTASRVSRELSEQYFQSRPRASQLSAAISAQSQPVASRQELEQRVADLEKSLDGKPVPLPDDWGGYILRPEHFEFWQGRLNRLHDRIIYRQENTKWIVERIQP